MGGNALKQFGVERKSVEDYHVIVTELMVHLRALFPHTPMDPIQAYRSKTSFGDADILIASDTLPSDWMSIVETHFRPHAFLNNSPVHSFDFQNLQIDLIGVPKRVLPFAKNYFDFNDLGNLMGRVAHKMGLKYGHLGLYAPLRDGDHQYAELLVTDCSAEAMAFLGYDHQRHANGFDSLEDIFEFTISSPYVHRDIFLLDNRNYKSRIRDAKRPTYTSFLEWLKDHPEADKTPWPTELAQKTFVKATHFSRALTTFPEFAQRFHKATAEHRKKKDDAAKWNGHLVLNWTGLSGRELGMVVGAGQKRPDFHTWLSNSDESERREYARTLMTELFPNLQPSKTSHVKRPST
jgi:hypothetical protein